MAIFGNWVEERRRRRREKIIRRRLLTKGKQTFGFEGFIYIERKTRVDTIKMLVIIFNSMRIYESLSKNFIESKQNPSINHNINPIWW